MLMVVMENIVSHPYIVWFASLRSEEVVCPRPFYVCGIYTQ